MMTHFQGFKQASFTDKIHIVIATWFFSGFLPKAPGTWGSLAALPVGALIHLYFGWPALLAASALLFPIGVWSSSVYVRVYDKDDPGQVVIDEVVGIWIALALLPLSLFWYLVGFALFRVFDVLKPFPISYLDRNIKGGLGIMVDDVLAGVFAAAVGVSIYLITILMW
jgi:phosphatidylglycerophosphatase A